MIQGAILAFGGRVWSENGTSWVDLVQPTWVLDFRHGMSGSGSLKYAIDTSLFHLKVVVLNYTVERKQSQPSFSISGGTVSYSLPSSCTFLVCMEAN